jgi:SAM-dependent methyltransferase
MRLLTPAEQSLAYTNYRHHEGYAKRVRLFAGFPEPILVVGCGFGFLVQEFEKLGKEAWGIDASAYAFNHRVSWRVLHGDILDNVERFTAFRFATIILEDIDPWLTDAEAVIAARNCAQLAPIVVHLVTEQGQADYNYHSTGYWMSLTAQLTVSLEGM